MPSALTPLGNPQGKGLVGVINDFHQCTPKKVTAKSNHQWLADYFTSILILAAECLFKPVINKTYYLYLKDGDWKVSMIEPSAWNTNISGIYFAECSLHHDRTWSITPKQDWHQNKLLFQRIQILQNEFLEAINTDTPLLDTLPFFEAHLPYYRRISANALARSLRMSLVLEKGYQTSKTIAGNLLLAQTKHPKLLFTDPKKID